MELSEEIKKAAMQILAKHGKADHKFVYRIYRETGIKPYQAVSDVVCKHYKTTLAKICAEDNHEDIAHTRHMLCYLLFHESGLHMGAIGAIIKRSRTTVHASINRIKGQIQVYEKLFDEVHFLIGLIETS